MIRPEDTTVLCGDLSWALGLEAAKEDFAWIDQIPGRKIILKGNHDYWWSTASKFYKFCQDNQFSDQFILNNNFYEYEDWAICGTRGWFFEEERSGQHDAKVYKFCQDNQFSDQFILNNNFYEYEDWAICGTRGWFFEEERSGQHDAKVFHRELLRLETSLKAAGDREKLVFLHYPPKYRGYECREIIDLLHQYQVRRCYYGHLHADSRKLAMEGVWDGVEYRLVSADHVNFCPVTVIL